MPEPELVWFSRRLTMCRHFADSPGKV